MKKITLLIILLLTFSFGYGQTTLAEGDIAITGVISDNPDEFSFVLLTDVLNGTTIHFTDNGWLATGGFRTPVAEGIVTWTATSDLPCGTEILIADTSSITPNTYSSTSGTAVESSNGFGLASAGDQIIAYQGSSNSNPTFLYAVHFGSGTGWVDATDNNNSAVPAGLTEGVNAIDLGDFDNNNYLCTVTNNQTLILDAVATVNATNWYQTDSNSATNRPTLGGCSYTCTAAGSCVSIVTWNGTTWVGGTPDLTTEVNIDADFDTGNGGSEVSFKACSLTINNGAILTVSNNTFVEVENNVLVDDGELRVRTQGNFVQNDNSGTFLLDVSGTANVNKVTPAKLDWLHYTYWSSPVVGASVGVAFPFTPADRRFWFRASSYEDLDADDIDDNNDAWQYAAGTDIMQPGVGYAATAGPFHTPGGNDSADFSGVFNTGDISTGIINNASNVFPAFSWNFIGNPYPSAIDFIAFQAANSTIIDGAAYFWSQSLPPSSANPGNQVNNFNQNDYATYTVGTGGAAGANGIVPTQYIPSAQGFFIAGLSNGNATFTNAMRMADVTSNNMFFKGSKKNSETVANKLWVNLTSDNGVFNQVLVGYVDGATEANDGLSYDAPKLLSTEYAVLYTSMENSDKKFVIQGKAPSDLNENEIIDLGFKTAIDVPTVYTFSIAQFQGDFINNNPVFLIDNLLNKTHNLKVCDYNFTSEVGEFNSRFKIAFSDKALSTKDFGLNDNALKIIELDNDHVNFKLSDNFKIKSVTIFDLLGRPLYNLKGANSSETYQLSKLKNTVFIAKVELSNGAVITKKAVKK